MSNLREASEYYLKYHKNFPLNILMTIFTWQASVHSELEFQELKQAFQEFDKVRET